MNTPAAPGDGGARGIHVIDDAADPRLDDFRNLADADVRADRRGIVIAEGVNVVERMARSPYRIRAVVGVQSRIDALRPVLDGAGAPAYVVDKWVLSDVVGFRVTRGVLASAARPAPLTLPELLGRSSRLAVLEGLNDFENLGALFRNAAAFGVDGVVLDPQCADPLYRRSVRVSMGHVLRVPFAVARQWPEAIDEIARAGFEVLAMTPRASARPIAEVAVPAKWAVLLGAEGPGLSERALAAAHGSVRIPMASGVDSLNVATAAAVAFAHLSA